MQHIKQVFLPVQQKSANSASFLSPYRSRSSTTSEMTPIFILVFSPARSKCFSFYTAFLHQSAYFFSLTWSMVAYSSALLLLSILHHFCRIWPGESRHCTCVGEGHCPVCAAHYSHWVEPQTADLYLILLSDHNDNFRIKLNCEKIKIILHTCMFKCLLKSNRLTYVLSVRTLLVGVPSISLYVFLFK